MSGMEIGVSSRVLVGSSVSRARKSRLQVSLGIVAFLMGLLFATEAVAQCPAGQYLSFLVNVGLARHARRTNSSSGPAAGFSIANVQPAPHLVQPISSRAPIARPRPTSVARRVRRAVVPGSGSRRLAPRPPTRRAASAPLVRRGNTRPPLAARPATRFAPSATIVPPDSPSTVVATP